MNRAKLGEILLSVHEKVERGLKDNKNMSHPVNQGDANENQWIKLLGLYLPKRYQVMKASIVDSNDHISQQIDIVIFDRQYSPFIWEHNNGFYIPAESVYAVFEVKPTINAQHITYAKEKALSVRKLYRTNLPVPHAGGIVTTPRPLFPIMTGILSYKSDWSPALGPALLENLEDPLKDNLLDIGCIASEGIFTLESSGPYSIKSSKKAVTAFLFELIRQLQLKATVPMIDIMAYAKWLD